MMQYFLLFFMLLILACQGSSSTSIDDKHTSSPIEIDFSYNQINIEKLQGSNDINLTIGEGAKALYLLFTI